MITFRESLVNMEIMGGLERGTLRVKWKNADFSSASI